MLEVRDELSFLVAEGGTDDQIHDALRKWPTHRMQPASGSIGQPWGTQGGDIPKFYYGHDATAHWPSPKATLVAEQLYKAVRKALAIPRKAKARKAKAS
jgi:hypothetical protein